MKATSAQMGDGINIFCINGDEVEQASAVLADRNLRAKGSKNVIYPAWDVTLSWGMGQNS